MMHMMNDRVMVSEKLLRYCHTPLRVMRQTLNLCDYSERNYTIWGMRDDSLCLIMEEGMLVVFYFEKGVRYDTTRFQITEIEDVCRYMLRDLALGHGDQERMVNHFNGEMKRRNEIEKEEAQRGHRDKEEVRNINWLRDRKRKEDA